MKIKKFYRKTIAVVVTFLFLALPLFNSPTPTNSASLTAGSVTLSDSRPSTAGVTYTVQFSNVTTSAIKCIKVAFSDAATAGSKPTGMTITSATLGATTSYVPTPASWTIGNLNSTGISTITFASGETPASASNRTVVLAGITNGSTADTQYYVQFSTFNNVDCSTSPVDSGVISYIYTNGQAVTATVNPSLSFTVNTVGTSQSVNGAVTTVASTGTTIPFGVLTTASNAIIAHDLTLGTNANSGYTVTTSYTGQLASGSHNMTDWSGTNAAPTTFSGAGTESFGYTTNDATLGTGTAGRFSSNKWAAFTTSPLEVAYSAAAVSETTRTGYQVGISSTTPAGSYSTTVIYTATPTY